MSKITFIGAGSAVFALNVLGDCMLTPALQGFELALYDIDAERLQFSAALLNNRKEASGSGCTIKAYDDRKEALRGAKYVINAIRVGVDGVYDPSTLTDLDIPKKYGLRQSVGDTVGIGGLFRNLRTIPVMLDIANDVREVCPNALFLNYTNPMAVLTNVMNTYGGVRTVGLCHSVQVCIPSLFKGLGLDPIGVQSKIAGINHMAWLLEVTRDGQDLYPEIKRLAKEKQASGKHGDMVRYEMMFRFGYYNTESSEHTAEYHPYFIKRNYPELLEKFNIPLDVYARVYPKRVEQWNNREQLLNDKNVQFKRSHEYASYIFEAMETNKPIKIGANVMNTGLITNLPFDSCVEVPCIVDAGGVTPTYVGALPQQLAALNRTNINTQLMTIEAAMTRKREHIYQAAMLDPHTAAELSIDDIVALCDELIEAHGKWLPAYS